MLLWAIGFLAFTCLSWTVQPEMGWGEVWWAWFTHPDLLSGWQMLFGQPMYWLSILPIAFLLCAVGIVLPTGHSQFIWLTTGGCLGSAGLLWIAFWVGAKAQPSWGVGPMVCVMVFGMLFATGLARWGAFRADAWSASSTAISVFPVPAPPVTSTRSFSRHNCNVTFCGSRSDVASCASRTASSLRRSGTRCRIGRHRFTNASTLCGAITSGISRRLSAFSPSRSRSRSSEQNDSAVAYRLKAAASIYSQAATAAHAPSNRALGKMQSPTLGIDTVKGASFSSLR